MSLWHGLSRESVNVDSSAGELQAAVDRALQCGAKVLENPPGSHQPLLCCALKCRGICK